MSEVNENIESLREENQRLREEIASLKKETSGESGSKGGKAQPVEGMMKLLKKKNEQIQESVQQLRDANAQLQQSYEATVNYYKNTVLAMASAMEAKEPFFQFHSSQIESICRKIAASMNMERKQIELLSTAALIHDFGNIGIRSSVLLKEGPLTDEEYQHVKTHPLIASIILEPIGDLDVVLKAIKHHHEDFDGSGYPEGVVGTEIPLFARIIYIAESFDAITSPRPYRKPLPKEEAKKDIAALAGSRYDPAIVEAFLKTNV